MQWDRVRQRDQLAEAASDYYLSEAVTGAAPFNVPQFKTPDEPEWREFREDLKRDVWGEGADPGARAEEQAVTWGERRARDLRRVRALRPAVIRERRRGHWKIVEQYCDEALALLGRYPGQNADREWFVREREQVPRHRAASGRPSTTTPRAQPKASKDNSRTRSKARRAAIRAEREAERRRNGLA